MQKGHTSKGYFQPIHIFVSTYSLKHILCFLNLIKKGQHISSHFIKFTRTCIVYVLPFDLTTSCQFRRYWTIWLIAVCRDTKLHTSLSRQNILNLALCATKTTQIDTIVEAWATFLRTTSLYEFSFDETIAFWFQFHRSVFLRTQLSVNHHYFK